MADLITDIEEAALARLTSRIEILRPVGAGAIQKDARLQIRDAAVAVAVLAGKPEKISQTCWRTECTVSVLLKFKNMQSEEARRKGINPIILATFQLLMGQKLNLQIGKLDPTSFRDVTTEEKYAAGVIEYLLEFGTWFDLAVLDEEAVEDLISFGIDYFLTDPADPVAQEHFKADTGRPVPSPDGGTLLDEKKQSVLDENSDNVKY